LGAAGGTSAARERIRVAGRGWRSPSPDADVGSPTQQPRRLRGPEIIGQFRRWAPDVIVVAAFGQILRKDVLELPPHGCINVHASLLPRWRGASPIQAAILHGDAETGVTIMRMDAGLDTGPILSQRAIAIEMDDTADALSDKLAIVGAELLIETLPQVLAGGLQPQPQPDQGMTTATTLTKADGELDLSQSAEPLARKVGAYNPWPGAFIVWKNQPLKIHRAHAAAGQYAAGRRIVHHGLPALAVAGGLLVLDEVQPAGKKPMAGADFLHGAKDWQA